MTEAPINPTTGTYFVGGGPLARRLSNERGAIRANRGDLTVLSAQSDPYRLDNLANHRNAIWFAQQLKDCVGPDRGIHLRGLHYAIVIRGNVEKPDGEIYRNSDEDWEWLQTQASKPARWLGYIPFDRIIDNRNSAPEFTPAEEFGTPEATVVTTFYANIPRASDIGLDLDLERFVSRQPYKIVFFGEKSSLSEILNPLCGAYKADCFLPTGEITDSQLHLMAKRGAEDGRPMVVFTLSDFDPAGYQMPISIGRKLQALRDLCFPDLDYRVVPIGLTAQQAIELDLPSTPLKATERRADRWRDHWNREQTEIDAILALQPDALRRIIMAAVEPYFDVTLDRRVARARAAWLENSMLALNAIVGSEVDQIRADAEETLDELRAQVRDIEERIDELADSVDPSELPAIEVPEPQLDPPDDGDAICSSSWSWLDNTRSMKARKAYGNGEDSPE